MAILVSAASKHGATSGIAEAIAHEFNALGLDCMLRAPEAAGDAASYDAFVLGSAIYMGRWQDSARAFLDANAEVLKKRPVWIFSSGPLGDNENVGIDPRELEHLIESVQPREHRLFAGKLDRSTLGRGERLISRVVKAPEGDYRDWEAIRAWAREIASSLQTAGART
jgi:menaquinone-dependent protoporphyrinogen oxidase